MADVSVSATLTVQGFDVAADLARLAEVVATLPNELAQVAGDAGQTAIMDAVVDIRGSVTMSNNQQGSTLDAFPIVREAEVEIQAVPKGVWHLVEYGAVPHVIRPKRGPGGRSGIAGTKRALNVSPYGVFAKVNHPGAAGTRAWSLAMEAAEEPIDTAVREACDALVDPGSGGGATGAV